MSPDFPTLKESNILAAKAVSVKGKRRAGNETQGKTVGFSTLVVRPSSVNLPWGHLSVLLDRKARALCQDGGDIAKTRPVANQPDRLVPKGRL